MRTFCIPLIYVLLAACSGRTTAVAPAPQMISRAAWGAAEPVSAMVAHTPSYITIHHTGVRSNANRTLEQKLKGLQTFSQREDSLAGGRKKPAWPDVPYHYYIDITGRIGIGRDVRFKGDTNTEYDPTGHILVVVEGNFEEEQPTAAQMESLRGMVKWLASQWEVPAERIQSHKDYARTQCPGVNLYREMEGLRALVR
jgi:hypothetical protein